MSDLAVQISGLGKMYKLYHKPGDKILDAFGVNRFLFWKKHYYSEFWALRQLNLDIKRGERVGIIGRNGAGKSTLLKLIAGNIIPTEGVVQVHGRVQALLELGTGFHPELTGRQNIHAALSLNGLTTRQIEEKEDEIVDFAELHDFIEQPIKTYSAGMYARLAFSTATAIEPETLIVDEVLGAGDAYFAGKCVERMKRLTQESGATVLFVSHDLGSVQRFCDRAIWIDRGTIRSSGAPLDVIKEYSAWVRQEDEIRLQARDLRISKKHAAHLIAPKRDGQKKVLFHLIGENGADPGENHRISHLSLWADDQELGAIEVGQPMDNSVLYESYLLDEPKLMNWGPPWAEEHKLYRNFGPLKGQFHHAPFEFTVGQQELQNFTTLSLKVRAQSAETEGFLIEIHDSKKYRTIGQFPKQSSQLLTLQFDNPWRIAQPLNVHRLPEVVEPPEPEFDDGSAVETQGQAKPIESASAAVVEEPDENSEYGSEEIRLTSVQLLDSNYHQKRIFAAGESLIARLSFEAYETIVEPSFIFCVYYPDGQCATQVVVHGNKLGTIEKNTTNHVDFLLDPLILGKSEYIGSAAIFKYLRQDQVEAPAYHLLDRCIHFQVVHDGYPERGLCHQPYHVHLPQREEQALPETQHG